ncbi:MAG: zinc-ribbon and DUF3426 domain-containing protein [Burkholderiaceae bacterium]
MTLAARCTHCQTIFRISGPQLAAAQGWVRCGQCQHVFDAAANLVSPDGQAIQVPTVQAEEAPVPQQPAVPYQPMPDIDLELPDLGALKPEPEPVAAASDAPVAPPAPAPLAAQPPVAAPRQGAPIALPVLLSVSLVALLVYAARGHIGQAWPEARPVVSSVCASLGCRLPALRQLESVSIEGSSLSLDDKTGHHTLRIQLRHVGDWPVAVPAFDLSILDDQGTVVARRMLDPMAFSPATAQLDPGGEAELAIVLNLKALETAAVGSFRVVPYYP